MGKQEIKNYIFGIKVCFKLNKKILFFKIGNIIFSMINLFLPMILVKVILDDLLTAKDNLSFLITRLLFLLGVLYLSRIMQNIIQTKLQTEESEFEKKFKLIFSEKAMWIEYGKLETNSIQNMIELANKGKSLSAYVDDIFQMIEYICKVAGCIGIVLQINFVIAILAVIPCIVKNVVNYFNIKESNRRFQILSCLWRKEGYLTNYSKDVSGAKELRVHGLETWIIEKLKKLVAIESKTDAHLRYIEIIGDSINLFFIALQTVFIYLIIIYQVVDGTISVGDFTFYVSSIFAFSETIQSIIDLRGKIKKQNIFATSLREFMYMDLEEKADKLPYIKQPVTITFKDVSFRYPNTENDILKNVNLTIYPGEKIIIVGKNGQGKTTLIKLLCRFYQPTEGHIYVNDIDINTLPYEKYIKLIGTIFQDFKLICGTIKENVLCGQDYQSGRLENSCMVSGTNALIEKTDKKWETVLYNYFDEEGIEPSGGESQKIAIARLLYKNSDIFILDEPTAALDPISEYEVFKSFKLISKEHTTIFISHRLSSVSICDKIAVLDGGKIAEYGNFEELMKLNGIFANMYQAQAQYYV